MIIIESDPMQNGRPVEALRVAAGLCVWQKMDIVLCLNGKGLLLMDWEEWQFEGFEHCLEYFKILADHSVAIYTIQKEHDSLLFSMKPPVKSIPLTEWSQLSVQAGCVLRF